MAANSSEASADKEMVDFHSNKAPLSVNDIENENDITEDSFDGAIDDNSEESEQIPLMELKRCKEWLIQQRVDQESELTARRLQLVQDLQPSSSGDLSVSGLYERISTLQDKLFSLSTANSYKKLVLDRLVSGGMLTKKLFPDTISDTPSQQQLADMNTFADAHKRQNSLCSQILENNQVLINNRETLNKVRKESFELKKSNRKLMAKLQRLKEEKESAHHLTADTSAVNQVKEQLDLTAQKISVMRNILQALVVGSAIDWASDEETRQMVLSLGEPLEFTSKRP